MEVVIPERTRNLILKDRLTIDEREILEEWLADCDEDEYEEYLRLKSGEAEEPVPDDEM